MEALEKKDSFCGIKNMKKSLNEILSIPLDPGEVISNLSLFKKELSKKKISKSKLKIAILGGSSTQHIRDSRYFFVKRKHKS